MRRPLSTFHLKNDESRPPSRMHWSGGETNLRPQSFAERKPTTAVSGMIRSGIVAAAALVAVLLPSGAFAGQTRASSLTRSFTGLAAFYPGRGAGYTAAHRTLPFGTRVRVTDAKTGRSVIVRINDRGPFGRGRVLDLSTEAARALGMIDRGVILVRADVL